MSNFDPNAYFANLASNSNVQSKLDALAQASKEKAASLEAMRAQNQQAEAQFAAQQEADRQQREQSWAGQLGLTSGGFLSNRVNDAASLVSGASRVLGQITSLPTSLAAFSNQAQVNEGDIEAYNRYVSGNPQLGDVARLYEPKAPNRAAPITELETAKDRRGISRDINNFFDLSKTVDPTNRRALADDLGQGFDSSWGQLTKGIEEAKQGNLGNAAGGVVKGLAGLLYNAGAATLSNPSAVREYVLENAPQLLVGAAGKAGQAAMTASNIGYAVDNYQQGIENYAKANNGQLPPEAERERMAVLSASLALAEQAGDMVGLGLAKAGTKLGLEPSRSAFKNTMKAALGGAVVEAPTEGYQTWAEGEITGKPASAKDIYTGAVIGGAAGGGLTGSLRLAAELTGNTPEQVADRTQELSRAQAIEAASRSGDITSLVDPESPYYSPTSAIAVLQGRATQADATPEQQADARTQADKVLSDLVNRREVLQSQLELNTPEGVQQRIDQLTDARDGLDPADIGRVEQFNQNITALEEELQRISPENLTPEQVKGAQNNTARFQSEIAKLDEDIQQAGEAYRTFQNETELRNLDPLTEAQGITGDDPAQSQASAQRIINLSMASPSRVDPELAQSLADNTSNGLSNTQRTFLRAFAEERINSNALKSMSKVSNDIQIGDPGKFVGLDTYRQNVSTLINAGRQEGAVSLLDQLNRFVSSHQEKAQLVTEAFNQWKAEPQKQDRTVVRNADGRWTIQMGRMSEAERKKNGAVVVNAATAKLARTIPLEAQIISATHDRLRAAVDLKFSPATPATTTNVTQAPETVQSQTQGPQIPAATSTTGTDAAAVSPTGSTVESTPGSGTAPAATGTVETPRVVDTAPATATAIFKTLETATRETLSAGTQPDPVAQDLLTSGKLPDLMTEVVKTGITQINGVRSADAGSIVLNTDQGDLRLGRENSAETINSPNVIQPIASATVQGLRFQLMPKADTANITEADVQSVSDQLAQEGLMLSDPGTDNIGRVNGRLVVIDPGAVQRMSLQTEGASGSSVNPSKDTQNTGTESTQSSQEAESTGSTEGQLQSNQKTSTKAAESSTQEADTEADTATETAATETATDASTEETTDTTDRVDPQAVESAETTAEAGTLAAVREKTSEETAHGEKKLGDFFTQSSGKDTDGSKRPLVAVKDFLSAVAAGTVKIAQYIKDQDLSEGSKPLVWATFVEKAAEWSPIIVRNLKVSNNERYNYLEPVRYLIQSLTVNGNARIDVEENVKTAISAAVFAFVADHARRPELNDDGAINSILGRSKDSPVSTDAREQLENVGVYQAQIVDSLGSAVLDALGLRLNKNAPQDMLAKMRVSLGGHALKLMEDSGMLVRTPKTSAEIKKLRGEKLFEDSESGNQTGERNTFADNIEGHIFYKLVRDKSGEVVGEAKIIADAIRGSQSLIQNLFGIESSLSFPSLTPPKGVQQKSDTGMGVPGFLKKVFKLNQKRPWKVNRDPLRVLGLFSEEEGMEMAGIDESTDHVHKRNLNSHRAKNEGLIREFRNFMDFVGELVSSDKGLDQEFYLSQDMWKQQRTGYKSNTVNPNTSKIVRQLVAPDSWTTEIDLTKETQLQSFMLRASEGFGIKPEKNKSQKAVDDLSAIMQTPTMVNAVKALQAVLFDEGAELTEQQRTDIKDAVKAGKQRLHTLTSLIAYARYQQAVDTNANSFTTNLMGEVDGVSNGSILNSIMYGAAETVEQLNALLEKGGIYTLTSKFGQYNLWRGTPGHQDIYESNAQDLHAYVDSMPPETRAITAAIWATAGSPINAAQEATKDGRDLLKGPINPLNYGGGFKSIIGKMAYNYVDTIYEKLQDFSRKGSDQATVDAFVRNVNTLLSAGGVAPMPMGKPIDFYLGYTLSKAQERALRNAYSETIGVAAQEVVKSNFKPFLDRSKLVTRTVNLTYSLYEAVYDAAREAMIKELDIPRSKGEPIHDLTLEQEAALAERLKDILPMMHTAMSKEEGIVENGILLAKKSRKQNNSAPYKVVVGFGSKLKNNASQLTASGRSMVQTDPGVIAISGTTHALDSFSSHEAQEANHVLNNHDAVGAGINVLAESAELLNKSTWKNTLNYSPLNEAHDALVRVVRGIAAMNERGELTPEIKDAIKKKLQELSKQEKGSKAQSLVDTTAFKIFNEALNANRIKLGAMTQWAVVDQYAMDGGSYQVTDVDRQLAQDKLNALSPNPAQADIQALDAFAAAVFGSGTVSTQPKATVNNLVEVTKAFGPLGESNVKHDADLVSFFTDNSSANVSTIAQFLSRTGRLSGFNQKLLALAVRTLAKVDPTLRVRYVTPQTDPKTLLALPKESSRGWYIATAEGKTEIYVLSPEFQNSGLTAETILHELVHAALARAIDNPQSEDAKQLIAELEDLRQKAQDFVTENALAGFDAALSNVQEFVAWGMTSLAFQRDVLTKIRVQSKTKGNALVSGMQKFISTLTQLLFKKPDENIDNGLSVLVSNVSGLFYQAAQETGNRSINLSMAAVNAVDSYTTLDIFNALDNGTVSPGFREQLSNLLGDIVEKLHGPYGSFASALRRTEASNPLATWLKAQETGQAPFASRLIAAGFTGSAQEDFVAEQVEATVRAALQSKEVTATALYRELNGLYNEARLELKDKLSPSDYEFLFDIQASNGNRSEHLARFAALGLSNQKVNEALSFQTRKDTSRLFEGETVAQRLIHAFEKILALLNEKMAHVFAGQPGNDKLASLVTQLVDIEARNRHGLAQRSARTNVVTGLESGAKTLVEAARSRVADLAGSNLVQQSSSEMVRMLGNITKLVAQDRTDEFMDALRKFRDRQFKERDGLMASLMTELRGPKEVFQALIRAMKHLETQRKQIITQNAKLVLSSFVNGKTFTPTQSGALTKVFMQTGLHHLLDAYSLDQMDELLGNPEALKREIEALQEKLAPRYRRAYIEQANALGAFKATGIANTPVLMYNAHSIARLYGVAPQNQISESDAKAAEPVLAMLSALYALKYTTPANLAMAKEILRDENARTDEGHGVEFILKLHKQLEAESLERLFNGNPALMIHGYTPDITDPYTSATVVNEDQVQDYSDQGYQMVHEVRLDEADPNNRPRYLMVLKDGGLAPWVSSAFSLTSEQSRGTDVVKGYFDVLTTMGVKNASTRADITAYRTSLLSQGLAPERDMTKGPPRVLHPVFNDRGEIVNWRYMMVEQTKDSALRRDNRVDQVMGTLAGSIFDKTSSKEQNAIAVKALRDQYDEEYRTNPSAYLEIGPESSDPKMKELWTLLPQATRDTVRKVWGWDGMKVRKDSVDVLFGYRKYSLAEAFKMDPENRKGFNKFFAGFVEWMFEQYGKARLGYDDERAKRYARKAAVIVTRSERIWQELVREAKDMVVVKSGVVLLGNIYSNMSLLVMQGVSFRDIFKHHQVALRAATSYQQDAARLAELETLVKTGMIAASDKETQREMARLRDALDRNPVKALIDEGLMPTIVEDAGADENIYSYKSEFARRTQKYADRLNPAIRSLGRNVYMAKDTWMYQSLHRTTQLSDFVARYTLYQHLTTRAENPLSHKQAIQEASDAFVNYDIPMHRSLQYTDDMGITMFTKYFLRIQRVLVKTMRENPARALSLVGLNQLMDLGPMVLDSSLLNHLGNNPIHTGPFQILGAASKMSTVTGAMSIIK
jgi:hypothetical protein